MTRNYATPSVILQNDGILAVVSTYTLETPTNLDAIGEAGPTEFVELASWALTGFYLGAVKDSARYVVSGQYTVLLERAPHGAVALVLITGHPIVKSAVRLARRLLRSVGLHSAPSKPTKATAVEIPSFAVAVVDLRAGDAADPLAPRDLSKSKPDLPAWATALAAHPDDTSAENWALDLLDLVAGGWPERSVMLVLTHGRVDVHYDSGAPEDNTFGLDWSWVQPALEAAYEAGKAG